MQNEKNVTKQISVCANVHIFLLELNTLYKIDIKIIIYLKIYFKICFLLDQNDKNSVNNSKLCFVINVYFSIFNEVLKRDFDRIRLVRKILMMGRKEMYFDLEKGPILVFTNLRISL